MKKTLFALALAAAVLGAVAQEAAPKFSEAEYQSVYQLFEVMKLEEQMKSSTAKMLEIQLKGNPMLSMFREEMTKFMDKHASYQALKKDLANTYLKHFNASDIKELIAFCQTPLGKKFMEKGNAIAEDIMELTARRVMENQGELQKMIMEKNQSATK